MKERLFNYLVSILHNDTKESMMLQAPNMNETKSKVLDVVMRTSMWNYKEEEFYLECYRIRILEGGNHEIVKFRRVKRNRKQSK